MNFDRNPARIAIIGNMNNNGFALMRYLRDLGADAWLLPFSTDGVGNLAHFKPSNDTWDYSRWEKWISPLDVPNTSRALIGKNGTLWWPGRRAALRERFDKFDHFIGSGVAAALMQSLGRELDIFSPYSIGVELYGNSTFSDTSSHSFMRRLANKIIRSYQANGIIAAKHCLNAEMSLTKTALDEIGKPFKRLAYPMLYNRERAPSESPHHLANAIKRLRSADLSMFCCARLLWVPDQRIDEKSWARRSKNSDWMFRGLASYIQRQPDARVVLAVVEYGPDVEASRQLVNQLGLESYVVWLPKLARKDIMLLLNVADVGFGEFYRDPGVIWGGTGWEILAAGRPLIQSFNFTAGDFSTEFGHSPPPILDVTCPADIEQHIERLHLDKVARHKIGDESMRWFNKNNGIGLAAKWLKLATGGDL